MKSSSIFLLVVLLACVSLSEANESIDKASEQFQKARSKPPASSPPKIDNKSQNNQDVFRKPEGEKAVLSPEAVDFEDILKELENSSRIWPQIIDPQPKKMIVRKYIDWYAQRGVLIKKSEIHYVELIDDMSRNNPNLLAAPFKDVMKFVSIVEYDFDNGADRDEMAKSILSEQLYRENRRRLGLE